MIDMGAPETDIDAYLQEEGVSAEQLRAHRDRSRSGRRDITVTFADGSQYVYRNAPANLTPEQVTERAKREFGMEVIALDGGRPAKSGNSKASPSAMPNATPSPDARSIIQSVFPQAEITSWKRDPGSALSRANPNSWHSRSGAAVDVKPIPGMTYDQALQSLKDAGYQVIESRDEVNNPAPWATGPHWHFVLGGGDAASPTDQPPTDSMMERANGPQVSKLDMLIAKAKGEAPKPKAPSMTAGQSGVLGFGDSAMFGFLDEAGAVADSILGGNQKTIWDGSSFSDAYDANVKANREKLDAAWDDNPGSYIAGGVVGGLIPISRAGKAAMAAKELSTAAKLAKSAKSGAAYGAAYGAGSDEGGIVDRLDGAALGGVTGAATALGLHTAATKIISPAAEKLMPKLAQSRFEERQTANRYAAYDRAISQDVQKIVSGIQPKPNARLTKAQQSTLVSRLSDLENSYMPYDDVKALGIRASEKAKLKKAMDNRHLLGDDEIDALADGTPGGDAAAESIRMAQRLRALIPEVSDGASPALKKYLAETLGGTAGFKVAGPFGGAAGAAVGRALTRSQTNSAAVTAMELSRDAAKFAKMPDDVFNGAMPMGYARSKLAQMANEFRDAPFLAKQEADRLQAEGRKVAIANARDNVKPGGGLRGLIYDRTGLLPADQDAGVLTALKDGAISPDQFQAFLDAPEKLMEGKAGLHLMDRLASMADNGLLNRDPKWSPPEMPMLSAPMMDAQGQPIRSLPAYQAGAAKNIARELQLLKELDEVDPIRGQLGGGAAFRDSDIGALSEADAARAAAIRSELARMKPGKGKPQ